MDEIYRDRVRERDLDNFLVEEIYASRGFLSWIESRLGGRFAAPRALTVRLHKSPPREVDRRQTDVRIGWFDEDAEMRACVLIESKVTADFQSGQAEAYASELEALRIRLGATYAAAILVAPAAKMPALTHDGCFDAEIAIENIIDFMHARNVEGTDPEIRRRLEMRIQLLEALCGKRTASGWVGSTIAEKRDFAESYVALAGEILPELGVRPSTDGPKAITRIFEGLEVEGLPPLALRHEFGAPPGWKYANVLFSGIGDRVARLRESGLLAGTSFTAEQAGKSLAIRLATPAVDPMRTFDDERESVERGLLAIRELVTWLRQVAPQLGPIVGEPGAEPFASRSMPTEAAFAEQLMETYRECERLGYRPTGMLQMIHEHGAIETARRLIAYPPSEGFSRLATMNRLDLAIESIVQREPWRALFTDDELRRAARKLR
ncbi:MAG: hypothetical protein KKD64_12125 [Alphaproteobacteria bacterium]|nr:hypothetical protein [Alphaproteobacteria bacterium]MBU0875379.1 hypothetical protein [Alphaproteobacteria bacterium]MBU1770382.1 hypothetical protein [Alphaproteobacteria bacterium]